jgi:uncharacterized delta-60 repeat protein
MKTRKPLAHIRSSIAAVGGLLFSAYFIAIASPALAVAGDLDISFSGDGKATTNFTPGDDVAFGVAVQADGKIVTVGRAGGSGGRFALARYNTDGSLDTMFSGDGKVTTNFTSRDDLAFGVALQLDGKIVAGGTSNNGGRFALARYNTDGSLDPTFSGDGKVTTNFTARNDVAFGVAVQADGRIVAAGTAGDFGRFALARYNGDGSLDATFSGDGKVTTNFTAGDDGAFGVAVQVDGKIVAAGVGGNFGRFALARYNTDGSLDSTFSGDGRVMTNFTAGQDFANGLALQGDGKIVAAGRAGGNGGRVAVARYNTGGSLDATFSGDGKVTTNFSKGEDFANGVAVQADGKLVAAGASNNFSRFALVRYNPDGTLDSTFSGDGRVTTNFTSGEDVALGLAIQADGNIVAAGGAGTTNARFALARYIAA